MPPYRGFITRLNQTDVVVFDQESIIDAFSRQKEQLNVQSKISFQEAETFRQKSNGYITNLTIDGAMEISWKEIDHEASLIKYRAYSGSGEFAWGVWFEIEKG